MSGTETTAPLGKGKTDFRSRIEEFSSRFSEKVQAGAPRSAARLEEFAARSGARAQAAASRGAASVPAALREDYWEAAKELFTRDVTTRGLEELVRQDAGETIRFFAREVDFGALAPLPWYRRYPLGTWKLFLAMAYRLNPPRRLMFALGVPLLFVGWLRYLVLVIGSLVTDAAVRIGWAEWLLVAGTVVFVLLALELKDKLSLKGDLEIARQIQFGLLPFEPYCRRGVAIRASMRPANTVGGDYFDIIELDESTLAVAVGDVAGKGMPAALLMALLQGSLRTLLTAGLRGSDVLGKLNAHLLANIPSNRLVTFFYGELEPATGSFRWFNAGHNPPFLLRADGRLERLAANGMALGILGDTPYPADSARLDAGERLVLYTDGITEAFNTREEEYGEERLAAVLLRGRELSQEELIKTVKADVLAFCGLARPRDDMTLLVVERVP